MEEEKKTTTPRKTTTKKSTTKKSTTKKTTNQAKKNTSNVKKTQESSTSTGTKKKSATTSISESTGTKKTTTPKKKVEATKKVLEEQEPKLESEKKVIPESTKTTMSDPKVITTLQIVAIILMIILVVAATAKIFYDYQESSFERNGYRDSYLVNKNVVSTIQCEEISHVTSKERSFIYIPNLGTEEEFQLEKKLANLIKDYHLENDFYVLSTEAHNCGEISDATSVVAGELGLTSGIVKTPVILFYRNGELMEVVEREDEAMLTDGDLVKVLDIYEIKP